MLFDVPVTGLEVLVLGSEEGTRRVVRRYRAAGARVTLASSPQAAARALDDRAQVAIVVDVTGEVGSGVGSEVGSDVGSDLTPDATPDAAPDVTPDVAGDAWAPVTRRLGSARLVVRESPADDRPLITLVGGGPGEPALLTVAARDALADADVVLVDRLATHEDHALVERLAPGAQVVDVGKRPGRHKIPQHEIQQLMVEEALAGKHVVRLKGGDPFVFGRGGEEVDAAHAAGVPVRVVPGISSAIAVPGAIGVPVTSREVSRCFTVVSGHDPLDEEMCRHLTGLGGTIVILMGMGTLVQSATALQRAGMAPATPVAIVQEGCTPRQRSLRTTLGDAARDVARERISSPAVVVVGAVAAVGGHEGPITSPHPT